MSILPLGNCVIYGLIDPTTGIVKYVGKTQNPGTRLREHLGRTRKTTGLSIWMKELSSQGLTPIFVFLDSVKTSSSDKIEIEWIQHFQTISPLLNSKKK